MRLGASSRRRKRAPSRSSSTIATAATATAASAGHSRFFTTAYYTHRQRRHTHTHTHTLSRIHIHTRKNSVNGRRQFGVLLTLCKSSAYSHTHTRTYIYTHIRRFFRYNIVPTTITLQVVPDPWPIYFVRHQNAFSIIVNVYRFAFLKNVDQPCIQVYYTIRIVKQRQ
ncbi:unnamed protein product [Aphis gossypii]|uniref:Uncharacterized protein n=1 Tax=Aphis gossypii TaxID=80765 RepID=A0A9P0J2P7_APHGO|nr:unnamed protein product [Aphis gossypii]